MSQLPHTPQSSGDAVSAKSAPAFTRRLTLIIVGWLVVLGLVMLMALLWQGIHNTAQADRQKIIAALDAATADIQAQVLVVEMTANSVERIVRTEYAAHSVQPDNAERLRTALEGAVAAFEQRPELSHLGIVLPTPGEYGNLERLDDGRIGLFLYSSGSPPQRLLLTDAGFVPWTPSKPMDAPNHEAHIRRLHQNALHGAQEGGAKGVWRLRNHPWPMHAAASSAAPWSVRFTKALYDSTGRLLGVLDANLPVAAVQSTMRSVQARYGVQMHVLELDDPPRLIGSDAATPQPVPTAFSAFLDHAQLQFDTQFADIVLVDGARQWMAAHILPGSIPWLVLVSRAAHWLDPLLGDMFYRTVAMLLMVVAVLAWIAIRMAHRFGQPLAELAQRVVGIVQEPATAVADAPPFSSAVTVQRFRETQTLAHALDQAQATIAREITLKKQEQLRLRELNADLEYLATHDELTGLPNRALIHQHISQAIIQSRRDGTQVTVLYVDLDRFKTVNDRYGHVFGNRVLKAAGELLARLIRPQDMVAHLSGDRFLILQTGLAQREDAARMVQHIMAGLKQPVVVDGMHLQLGGSIGVSLSPQDGETVDALISNADIAMDQAKKQGRNTYQFYTAKMGQAVQARIGMEVQLREAINAPRPADQLHLVYQPKVSLADGCITSCEVLLRWTNPKLGHVSPAQFIPIAEESGLIIPIGHWVLTTACQQAKAWYDAGLGPVRVAVNLSTRQFAQQDVMQWVADTLAYTGLPADCLELELTESLLPDDMAQTIALLNQLQALGVVLALDDFGTGYSNLGYLKHLCIHTLKIDQGFVRNLTTSAEDAAIVRGTIALAHNLGFQVLAEGVESAEHVQFLRAHGCDEIQGYYFSRPVDAQAYAEMLREKKRLD